MDDIANFYPNEFHFLNQSFATKISPQIAISQEPLSAKSNYILIKS